VKEKLDKGEISCPEDIRRICDGEAAEDPEDAGESDGPATGVHAAGKEH
jgi:uric acid transporter